MNNNNTLQKALFTIQKLKKLLKENNNKLIEPIAIVGMSCRLPECNNINEFWELLCQGKDVISDIPESRWNLLQGTKEIPLRIKQFNYFGGYLKDIESFDAYFFGISPREAIRMDPQQRILLEVTYESLEDAGIPLPSLAGSNTGVFSSLYASQFGPMQQLNSSMDALFLPTGNAVSIAANRVSYLLDLQGPSMVLDTACSSSLMAVQLACLYIQNNLCTQAIVNAVNINLLPSIQLALRKANMLSPTGQCHTFDASADGYVQGEGAGSIVLKPLSKAIQDKNKIYAIIMGSSSNQDGKTNGLTAPNGMQQEKLMYMAYKSANIDLNHISYIECHGTGTFLGDPIELEAIGKVFGESRPKNMPCWIGSVKTNVGHLEPAAGIISIIKAALILKYSLIPPHLNFEHPNPHIDFDKYALKIPQKLEQLPKYGEVGIAGVSGFGFGGANAHVILKEANWIALSQAPRKDDVRHCDPMAASQASCNDVVSQVPRKDDVRHCDPSAAKGKQSSGVILSNSDWIASSQAPRKDGVSQGELFTISAKDASALHSLINRWAIYLNSAADLSLPQICYNLHVRRNHYPFRLAIITHSLTDLYEKLLNIHAENKNTFLTYEIKKIEPQVISDFNEIDLTVLAQNYVDQAQIDWQKFEENREFFHIDMPLYSWQHQKYWPTFSHKKVNIETTHPFQAILLSSPLSNHQFEFNFDTQTLPEIQDSFNILHAGYYVEMLAFAKEQLKIENLSIHNLNFLAPLLIPQDKKVQVQLILESVESGYSFSFYSNDGNKNWLEHANGWLLSSQEIRKKDETDNLGIPKEFLVQASQDEAKFYSRITSMGMPAGETIRWVENFRTQNNEVFAKLRPPKMTEKNEKFIMKVHPGIVDGCIQSIFMALPENFTKPYVASQIGKLEFWGSPTPEMYVHANIKKFNSLGDEITADWVLFDKEHNIIIQCQDIRMKQLTDTIHIEKIKEIKPKSTISISSEKNKNNIMQYLTDELSVIFSMPKSDINIQHPLRDMGMDSLMALAIVRIIESGLGVTYPLATLMKDASISDIADYILGVDAAEEDVKTSLNNESSWLANRVIKPSATMRLFCFPYGGGGASVYREWQDKFPNEIEVCPIQLPGRENRLEENPITDINNLISLLSENLKSMFDLPFAFFGHSIGALISFEMIRYLRKHTTHQPIHFFISGYPEPRVPSSGLKRLLANLKTKDIDLFNLNQQTIEQLDDIKLTELYEVFKNLGLEVYSSERMDKSIIQILLPIFVGDMSIAKNYTYNVEPKLKLDATVFIGTQDTWVTPPEMLGWKDQIEGKCEFQLFNGKHLFINEDKIRDKIIEKITEKMNLCNTADIL